jgi:eukaryotic-like serine/threonine-protein kinase
MGDVYAAHDPKLDRTIALKLLRPCRGDGDGRLLREARVIAKLSHPNVITLYDLGAH